jgi:hypothetical protein
MAWLNLYTTASEATSLYTAIRGVAMRLQTKNESRTLPQLSADVCADALAAGLVGGSASTTPVGACDETADAPAVVPTTAFGHIKPTVLVTVPALTLLGQSEEPGDLAGYGPIDPDTARKLAGKSKTWYRLLTDPDTGAPLSLGRTRYKPTKAMRDFLELRDGTCRWKGCNRQAKHCEIDHTQAWEHGGPTDCDNLSHLCPEHHRSKHETTWQAKQLAGGIIQWTSPDGRSYVTEPEIRLPLPPKSPPEPQPGSVPQGGEPPDANATGEEFATEPDQPPPF